MSPFGGCVHTELCFLLFVFRAQRFTELSVRSCSAMMFAISSLVVHPMLMQQYSILSLARCFSSMAGRYTPTLTLGFEPISNWIPVFQSAYHRTSIFHQAEQFDGSMAIRFFYRIAMNFPYMMSSWNQSTMINRISNYFPNMPSGVKGMESPSGSTVTLFTTNTVYQYNARTKRVESQTSLSSYLQC
ncbi:hypothetical protein COOONC_19656 [Cooperia oncophora]